MRSAPFVGSMKALEGAAICYRPLVRGLVVAEQECTAIDDGEPEALVDVLTRPVILLGRTKDATCDTSYGVATDASVLDDLIFNDDVTSSVHPSC